MDPINEVVETTPPVAEKKRLFKLFLVIFLLVTLMVAGFVFVYWQFMLSSNISENALDFSDSDTMDVTLLSEQVEDSDEITDTSAATERKISQVTPDWIRISEVTASGPSVPIGADFASYEVFPREGDSFYFGRDKNSVYLLGDGSMELKGVSVTSFTPFYVTNSVSGLPYGYYYAKDANVAYWFTWQDWGNVIGADPATFFTDADIYPFAEDKFHVYFLDKIIPDADPNTFRTIANSEYATDGSYVFTFSNYCVLRENFTVEGADPDTFVTFGPNSSYSKDKNHVYFDNCESEQGMHTIVEGADPTSFVASTTNKWSGSDSFHQFVNGKILE